MQNYFSRLSGIIFLTLFFSILGEINIYSQSYKLDGFIKDKSNKSVDIANVLLLNYKDSTFINGTISDAKGYFFLNQPKGKYLVKITSLGYKDKFIVADITSNTSLGSIIIDDDSKQLGEVTVTAAKPIIKRGIDRITFDTSNSSASIGGSLLDLLHDVPGIRATDNSVDIIGKGSVKVYIDDRETKMSGEELINYLRSYNASQVDKVEVITTPPAKYDAEGNSGIINIRLKYRPKDYIGGTLSLSYTNDEKESFGNGGLNLNLNKNNFEAFANVSGIRGHYARIEEADKHFSREIWKGVTRFKYNMKPIYTKAGIDYSFNNGLKIGTQITYNHPYNDTDMSSITDIVDRQTNKTDSMLYSITDAWIKTNRTNYNVHADKIWGNNKNSMNIDLDYLLLNSKTFNDFTSSTHDYNNDKIEGSDFDFQYIERRKTKVISSAADFTFPWDKKKITAGAKASHTNTRNYMDYVKMSTNANMKDDQFIYNENIFAAYADYSQEFSDKLSMQAGLRIEHTFTDGQSLSLDQRKKNYYTRLFPTFYILYSPNKDNSLNLNFSNRISRPSQFLVNPFMFFQNRYLYVQGRDDIQPYYFYNAEFSYTYKNNLYISIYYNYADNMFGQYASMDETDKVSKFFSANYMTTNRFGITNSYTLRLKWLQSYLQHSLGYINNRSSIASTLPKEESWIYNASIKNTIFFDHAKNFLADITASYTSSYKDGFYKMEPSYNVSAGLIYKMPKQRINMSLKFNNILYCTSKGKTMADNLLLAYREQSIFRGFMIGINYSFGKSIKSNSRQGSNSEIQQRL